MGRRRSNQAPAPSAEYLAEREAHRETVATDPQLLPLDETVRLPKELDVVDYVIVGPKEVFGHKFGDVVSLRLTKDQAANLIEAGHISVAEGVPAIPQDEAPDAEPVTEGVVNPDDLNGQSPDDVKE